MGELTLCNHSRRGLHRKKGLLVACLRRKESAAVPWETSERWSVPALRLWSEEGFPKATPSSKGAETQGSDDLGLLP